MWIKFRIPLISFIMSAILLFSSCGAGGNDSLSEVDIKNDLSVQITYRQISYNSTISFRDGILYLLLISDDTYPEGVLYQVTSSDVIIRYDDISKTYSYKALPDSFIPKLIYSFFSACGESFSMEKQSGEGSYIERNINGKSVRLLMSAEGGADKYYMEIK